MASAPRSLSELNMTTRVSWSCSRKRRRVSRPSMPGMWMSRVTTSGRSFSICGRASRPFDAEPTTPTEGSDSMEVAIMRRASAESSTMNTRIFWPGSRARVGLRRKRVSAIKARASTTFLGDHVVNDFRQRAQVAVELLGRAPADGCRRSPGRTTTPHGFEKNPQLGGVHGPLRLPGLKLDRWLAYRPPFRPFHNEHIGGLREKL